MSISNSVSNIRINSINVSFKFYVYEKKSLQILIEKISILYGDGLCPCNRSPQAVFAYVGEVQAVSQTGTIKGKIVDSYGEPVIGANVKVKGTTNGTITDMDGNFTLNNVSGGTLVISFIGYKTLEVSVKGTNLAKIIMHEDTEVLDEVVVVGYGTQKKESLTGSVTVVDQKLLKDKGTVPNPLSAMQGQVPGLRITRSSAAPGEEGWGVSIRGSVSKNKVEPLLIIDGVPASGVSEMAQLNADDIETINFLKDASAAIYGAKSSGWCDFGNYQTSRCRQNQSGI